MTIAAMERALYDEVLALEHYGDFSPGVAYLPAFLDMIGRPRLDGLRVLDAGCATGRGAIALAEAGAEVTLCDLTPSGLVPEAAAWPFVQACLWTDELLARAPDVDYVVCCDVLEHVPPQFTMLAVHQLLRVAREAVFLSIALVPDNFGAWVGRALHQTVQPYPWWRDSLRELGTVVEARDLGSVGLFLVTA